MVGPDGGERVPLEQGDYVRILLHAVDQADGDPAFGMVGESLPVGGVLVAQAGAGLGVFAPGDLRRVAPGDIPRDALADIHRRAGLTPRDPRPARWVPLRPPTRDETDQLRRELWRWDLIGLADDPGAPTDEYDCLIPLLWAAACSSEPSGHVLELEQHVEVHFGLTPVPGEAAAAVERTRTWIGPASR